MKDLIRPNHYKNNSNKDLFDMWAEHYTPEQFISIMESIADRYIKRHRYKNGVEDLDKAIYTLQRLREYEEKEAAK